MDFWAQNQDKKATQQRESVQEWLNTRERLLHTYSSQEGRLSLWELLVRGHFFRSTYSGNSLGMFMEGERNYACFLWEYIEDLIGDVIAEHSKANMEQRLMAMMEQRNG